MSRCVVIWTWDCGRRSVDLDSDAEATSALQTILEGGLWNQFRKFPPDVIARLLPRLDLPPHTKRLLELWIEEAPRPAA